MSINVQGSELYCVDPADDSVIEVACVLSIDGIDSTPDQIETTCMADLARRFEAGLLSPGAATFGIQFDPANASHVRLHELKTAGTTLKWALGLSDGVGIDPTADSDGDFVLPSARSWINFEGYMNSYPFSLQQNTKVTSNIGVQISGDPVLVPKT